MFIIKDKYYNLENSTYLDDFAYYLYRKECNPHPFYYQHGFFKFEKFEDREKYYKKAKQIIRKQKQIFKLKNKL